MTILTIIQVWIGHLSKNENPDLALKTYRSQAYFETLIVEVNDCSGNSGIHGRHIQILHHPMRRGPLTVSSVDYKTSGGDLNTWFNCFITAWQAPVKAAKCWRTDPQDGSPLCSGERSDTRGIVASIPVILAVELENFSGYTDLPAWKIPTTLLPDSSIAAIDHGLAYKLVGRALYRKSDNHFLCQYFSQDYTRLSTYDSMLYNGQPKTENGTPDSVIPKGCLVTAVFYSLQGGWNAQQQFYSTRIKMCDSLYNLSFSSTSLETLPEMSYADHRLKFLENDQRYWLTSPYKAKTVEYISKPPVRPWVDTGSNVSDGSAESEEVAATLIPHPDCPPSPAISVPESLFDLNCRCGISGNGNILYDANIYGMAIQCEECNGWLHIACQQDARAGKLAKKEKFKCDQCYVIIQKLNTKKLTKLQLKRCVIVNITVL